ncbi:MAG: hypothetical protein Tsb0014_08070 [Pleurocapsa sp.]
MKNTQTKSNKKYSRTQQQSLSLPMFFTILGVSSILGLIAAYYSLNPQYLPQLYTEEQLDDSINQNNLVQKETISNEDLSIGADLDNLDLLLQEIEANYQNNTEFTNNKITKNNADSNLKRYQDRNKNTAFSKTIENNSLQKVIQNSTSNSYQSLSPINKSSNPNSNNSEALGKLYRESKNQQSKFNNKQLSVKNELLESNSIQLDDNILERSPRESLRGTQNLLTPSYQRINSLTEQNNATSETNSNQTITQPNSLKSYQIQLKNYNSLTPSNYQLLPQSNTQVNSNNLPTTTNYSQPNLSDLNSYQLQPSTLNQLNLNIPNTVTGNNLNYSQPNNPSSNITTTRESTSDRKLQPSGQLTGGF